MRQPARQEDDVADGVKYDERIVSLKRPQVRYHVLYLLRIEHRPATVSGRHAV